MTQSQIRVSDPERLQDFEVLPQPSSCRLIDFDKAEVFPGIVNWTLDKEKTYLRNIYANAIGDNISSVSALFKAEKWLCQSVIE